MLAIGLAQLRNRIQYSKMFKFLLVGIVLSQGASKVLPSFDPTDTVLQKFLTSITVPKSETNKTDEKISALMPGNYNFHATHQSFYLGTPCIQTIPAESKSEKISKEIRSDYTVTPGIGAHKLHLQQQSWNKARHICIKEKGNLAVIRDDAEEKVIKLMMRAQSIDEAWVGFHDHFNEGDWVTMFDEPIDNLSWEPWSTAISPNPDNYGGEENCGCFLGQYGGMNDDDCEKEFPFICKISID